MKIEITPLYIANMALDTKTECAGLRAHLPRARKVANATALLSLLGQHYGTARAENDSAYTNRWFDCDKSNTTVQPNSKVNDPVYLNSTVGVITQEITVSHSGDYALAWSHIRVYLPLDSNLSLIHI